MSSASFRERPLCFAKVTSKVRRPCWEYNGAQLHKISMGTRSFHFQYYDHNNCEEKRGSILLTAPFLFADFNSELATLLRKPELLVFLDQKTKIPLRTQHLPNNCGTEANPLIIYPVNSVSLKISYESADAQSFELEPDCHKNVEDLVKFVYGSNQFDITEDLKSLALFEQDNPLANGFSLKELDSKIIYTIKGIPNILLTMLQLLKPKYHLK
jgi:hypothetical protein